MNGYSLRLKPLVVAFNVAFSYVSDFDKKIQRISELTGYQHLI